jgi:hypothetical protein
MRKRTENRVTVQRRVRRPTARAVDLTRLCCRAAPEMGRRQAKTIEAAILSTLPRTRPGMLFDELVDRLAMHLNPVAFPLRRTVSRYAKAVQLDLEERGVIERVPGSSPIRLRRVR